MMLTVSCILGAMEGHPWQMDIHMYFFAALAIPSHFAIGGRSSQQPSLSRCTT